MASTHSVGDRTTAGTVVVVEDEESVQNLVAAALRRAGYEVTLASNGREALERVAEALPDLIVSDVTMPEMDGLELLRHLRADPATGSVPVILLTAKDTLQDVVGGLELGADDYLVKPFRMAELLARVHAKIERPPVPKELVPRDRQTGLLSERRFREEVQREISRATRGGALGCLAYLDLDELPWVRERFGRRAEAEIARQVTALIQSDAGRLELAGRDAEGRFTLLLPEMSLDAGQQRLEQLSRRIAAHPFITGGESVRLTPALGYVALTADASADELARRALLALDGGIVQLDLHPVRYDPGMETTAGGKAAHGAASRPARPWARLVESLRVPFQIGVTLVVGLIFPLLLYALWGATVVNVAPAVYLIAVLAMLATAILITIEGFLALRAGGPPAEPGAPYPAASAIIAAYLPNEAPVIIETIEAFLRVEYPEPLQVILAYNTGRDMPIEAEIQEIARRDPRFIAMRVEASTSKAQNVNAALAEVTGEFVGVFDADHHPDPDSFTRAWRWLSNGYDVVQGHCLVRNGDASWVARLAAVEFESIYAVSHPGRARLHGFGVFGGSNGYWKTERLRRTRMRGWMLTEDIDSSMRVVQAGGKIASDPHLISRELAPVTLPALWHQRMRWAQGWFQVSFRHLEPALRSPHLSARQKLGLVQLLGWREIYPWLSLQVIPILIYHVWWRGQHVNWLAPFFLFTTLVMLSNRPAQTLFAYRLAHPDIRRRKGWWVSYFFISLLFYMEFKNLIARVAHIKEFMRERRWVVTPRARAKEV
jgi:CheY-like chemotaxis protein/cellulose synthase/poly-beta-1,6-N-acetylglucosamine synthase-like glycosyltransferase